MVLQTTGEISWSNFAVEYAITGEVGSANLRTLDKRLPQSTPVSSSNFYGLYSYPTTSNVLYLEASNAISYTGTGTTWNDLSGLSNNFIISNGISWNNLGYFTANTSHAGMVGPSNNAFSINNEHTLEFVVQGNTNSLGNHFIYFSSTAATGTQRMISMHLPWANNLIYYDIHGCCDVSQRLSVAVNTNTNPNTAVRHFVVRCRRTSTPNRHIYVNGTSIANSGTNSTSSQYDWGGVSYFLNDTTGNLAWGGDVYYIRLYNRALTDTEISNLYNTIKNKYGI